MYNIENVYTKSKSVKCFGLKEPLDHPLVYLEIDKDKGEVECPYCSKKFILKNKDEA